MAFTKGALTDEFRKRRRAFTLGTASPIQLEYKHPPSGAQLVLAKTSTKPYPVDGAYVVGWLAIDDEESLWYYRNFETRQKAMAFFKERSKLPPPTYNHFQSDPQINDVYKWEKLFRDDSPPLKVKDMEAITSRLADIFNMEAPQIIYKPDRKNSVYAEARLKDNAILMRRPHLAILLHEFAHLVNDQINKDDWAWHGPGFMRTYFSILSLFPKLAGDKDPVALAQAAKLQIADEEDITASCQLSAWIKHYHAGSAPNLMPSST